VLKLTPDYVNKGDTHKTEFLPPKCSNLFR